MASIVTRIRFTDKQLAHFMDCYIMKGLQPPNRINDLIRTMSDLGARAMNGNLYADSEPSLKAQQLISMMTRQRTDYKQQAMSAVDFLTNKQQFQPQQTQKTQQTQSTINTVNDFSIPDINAYLIDFLDDSDKTAGANMLAHIANGGVTIIENLQSDNKKVSKLTYEMFRHSKELTKEEEEAIINYEKSMKGES